MMEFLRRITGPFGGEEEEEEETKGLEIQTPRLTGGN